jgi:hypothetical protein
MLVTNQRLEKLASIRVDLNSRNLLDATTISAELTALEKAATALSTDDSSYNNITPIETSVDNTGECYTHMYRNSKAHVIEESLSGGRSDNEEESGPVDGAVDAHCELARCRSEYPVHTIDDR